ncbi:hypothetical protein MKZ38_003231 [Zalerion maritima]|uniref:Large ribosomal subunit protein mL44 n=1 Tax=Zalerion maritima TaxID=339359 RepID=A0AAD5S133_9PEZI|nr:hypothetical protein MKZ38_003231 [Zalerion maritima]
MPGSRRTQLRTPSVFLKLRNTQLALGLLSLKLSPGAHEEVTDSRAAPQGPAGGKDDDDINITKRCEIGNYEDNNNTTSYFLHKTNLKQYSAAGTAQALYEDYQNESESPNPNRNGSQFPGLPSPPPHRALESAKLAALHARLNLSERLPLQSLARCLVDSTADESLQFNNTHLAFLGRTIVNYHVSEYLVAKYPRLPMEIVFAAMKGYAGNRALYAIARQWGVEPAAAPGEEVDPGLLQFDVKKTGTELDAAVGYKRKELDKIIKFKFRRGISSRVVFDDEFGDTVSMGEHERILERQALEWRAQQGILSEDEMIQMEDPVPLEIETAEDRKFASYANFSRAVVGAVFLHSGREVAKNFVRSHVLSRRLDLEEMFSFSRPTRELAKLCQREGFERPVARILSETGRLSRTPVFVVGIYSGRDRLSEGWGPSIEHARLTAAMNGLKSWYLYSPGDDVRMPSETYDENAKPWTPLYVDMGEVIV